MAPTNYPYLDLTVLPEIRPHVITSRAVILFDTGFSTVLWANGEGAGLLGSPVLRDLLDSDLSLNAAMSRQIASAIEQLDDHDDVSAVVRIGRVLRSRLVGFNVRRIKLPGGESAVLMVTEELHGRSHSEQDMARTAVNSLDGYSHASAILAANGEIVAASEHFSALDVSADELGKLVSEVSSEQDRLVKRLINTANGSLAAGIARLSDDPASHILIIADANEAEATDDTNVSASTAAAAAAIDSAAETADASEKVGDEEGDADAAPAVGAFSNRRGAGAAGLGRWYYKQPKQAAAGGEGDGDGDASAQDAGDNEIAASASGDVGAGETPEAIDEPDARETDSVAADEQTEIASNDSESEAAGEAADDAAPDTETDDGETDDDAVANAAAAAAAATAAAVTAGAATQTTNESSEASETNLENSGLIQETSYTDGSDEDATTTTNSTDADSADTDDQDAGQADETAAGSDISEDEGFEFTVGPKPIRFVWDLDTNNEFRSVSDEFAVAVGPNSANVVGRTWSDLCKEFEIDNGEEVTALLAKGDTWSGKTVLWPVEGTDLRVPIDLAGLPSYGRNRAFEGFNGFGIVRTADAVVDPRASGLAIAGIGAAATAAIAGADDEEEEDSEGAASSAADADEAASAADSGDQTSADDPSEDSKIVDLGKRRESKNGRALSSDEQETFEEIGEKLSDSSASEESTDEEATEASKENTEDASNEPFIPSAFSGPSRKPLGTTTEEKPAAVGTPDHNVDTSILARLPIPVLVYRDNDLLFGNNQFFEQTGYSDLSHLASAGGIDALFGGAEVGDDDTQSAIYHANGQQLHLQANLQCVPWDDDRAMLLTLRAADDNDGSGSSDDQGGDGDGDDTGGDGNGSGDSDDDPSDGNAPKGAANAGSTPTEGATARLAEVVPLHQASTKPAFGGLGAEDLRNILDTATDGVVILSDEGIVRALNKSAEALFDVEPDAVLDQSFTKILAPESHRSAMDYLSGMSGTGVASLMNDGREVIGKTAKGGLIPLFMTIGKLQQTNACCAVMRDITQWKKAEEELLSAKSIAETASAQKTEFLAKVSHEIRTPLNAIIGFSDMMIEERFGKIDNDRYRGYLRDIHRSGNHVLELVNDLLDISKIEAGKMELEFDACDLNTIVSESVALTQPDANKERIIIRTSLSAVVPKVVADPRSLRQIILNLVSNSIKYTKPGGQVIVSTVYEESGEVVLRVRDTGIGMSELELTRALKPFQQINTESGTQGTGLGLPLTKAMVEANRARFEIESKPEEGTLVEIFFPNQRVLADR
ncbi:MAG: ATP-binding protein [Hyphomicrobiales bacterium]|nr:ATP-binding protein [Hyphomicrobiales bacterium]